MTYLLRGRAGRCALVLVIGSLVFLPGCVVVTVADSAASLAVGTVGLAGSALIGTARIAGSAVGTAADVVLPGSSQP